VQVVAVDGPLACLQLMDRGPWDKLDGLHRKVQ